MTIDYTGMLASLRTVLDSQEPPHQVLHNVLVNASAIRSFLLIYNYINH